MGAQRQSSIRLLAPAALALFAVVFLVVVVASLGGGDGGSTHVRAARGRAGAAR